ncbi:MAG: hypothetical protein HOM55_07990, partial [Proteobacteria bacterium]|nr:hypothetical protein [Pseudomonadota bacterium]
MLCALWWPKFRPRVSVLLFSAMLACAPSVGMTNSGNLSTGVRIGNDTGEAYLSLFVPIYSNEKTLIFFNPRGSLKDEGETEGNVGVGFRHLLGDSSAIVGANIYYDHRKSAYGNSWEQWGAGLEFLSDWVDARVNYYRPENQDVMINEASIQTREVVTNTEVDVSKRYTNSFGREQTGFSSTSSASGVNFSGNSLRGDITTSNTTSFRDIRVNTVWTTTSQTTTINTTTTDLFFEQFEGDLEGWDAELGFKIPLPDTMPEVRVFGGCYDFDKRYGGEIKGAKGRLEIRTGPYFTLDAEVFDDAELNDTSWFLGARLHLPFDVAKLLRGQNPFGIKKQALADFRKRPLESRMNEDVIRDVRIQTGESDFGENQNRRKQKLDVDIDVQEQTVTQFSTSVKEFSVSSVATGEGNITRGGNAVTILHIDNDNSGDPLNDAGAVAGTYENPHATATAANADGLDADVILIHGGSTVTDADIQVDSNDTLLGEGGGTAHSLSTDQGSVALPETASGAQAGAVPTISGVDIASSNVQVNNLTITNGSITTAVGGTHSNLSIQNITINGSGAGIDAIELGEGGALGGTIVLNNITVNSAGENGIDINNVLGAATIIGNNITITGSADDGLDIDDVASGAVFNFSNVNLMNSVSDGLIVEDGHGRFTFNNLDVSGSTGDGVEIFESTGTFNFDSASSIAGSGDSAFFIDNFSSLSPVDVNFAGTITHAGTFAAVDIENISDSTIVFGGAITSNNGLGGGIYIDFVDDSTVTFKGPLDIDTIGGGGVNVFDGAGIGVVDSFGSEISFDQKVDIDTSSGNGFLSGGNIGSTVSFNGGLSINTTSGGGFVALDGGTFNVAATTADESITTETGQALVVGSLLFTVDQMADITFDSINVTTGTGVEAIPPDSGDPGTGFESIDISRTGGIVRVNGGTIVAPTVVGTSAVAVDNNLGGGVLEVNLTNMTVTGAADGGSGVDVIGQSAALPVTVNLVNTDARGGAGTGSVAGGAGITATNAILTLDAASTATGGAAVNGGGGAGIGGIGGASGANGAAFGAGVTVTNNGT